MEELIKVWTAIRKYEELSNNVPEAFLEALRGALREAYSEGHCDGQNAADDEDPVQYPRGIDLAWARSQTQRAILLGLK